MHERSPSRCTRRADGRRRGRRRASSASWAYVENGRVAADHAHHERRSAIQRRQVVAVDQRSPRSGRSQAAGRRLIVEGRPGEDRVAALLDQRGRATVAARGSERSAERDADDRRAWRGSCFVRRSHQPWRRSKCEPHRLSGRVSNLPSRERSGSTCIDELARHHSAIRRTSRLLPADQRLRGGTGGLSRRRCRRALVWAAATSRRGVARLRRAREPRVEPTRTAHAAPGRGRRLRS